MYSLRNNKEEDKRRASVIQRILDFIKRAMKFRRDNAINRKKR